MTRLSSVHHPPPPFAFSSKYLLFLSSSVQYVVSNLNFQLVQFPIAFQKWKKYRGGEPATDKQSSRKTRTTAYFPACSPHFVSGAYGKRRGRGMWSYDLRCTTSKLGIRLCIPPPSSPSTFVDPLGELLLSEHQLLVFFVFLPRPRIFLYTASRSLLNITPIACHSVTNVLSFFIEIFECDRAYLSLVL